MKLVINNLQGLVHVKVFKTEIERNICLRFLALLDTCLANYWMNRSIVQKTLRRRRPYCRWTDIPRDLKEHVREDNGFKMLDQKSRKFKCRIVINRSKRAFSNSRTSSECGSLSG